MGYDVTVLVHADGEIWSATNFRIRTLLNQKYDDDFRPDDADLQSPARTASCPRRTVRGTGAGSSSTTTRCC